ncbi:MAG TPA: hypothetical protein K8V84_25485 [Nocardiopsis listeri]|uniref:hypothetical protein n=1 Tax=Nocardiopsis listeri TaxID=53440 RepID=UPI001D62360C|nr:hypothetical protein [Nocardiopsis listeri]HJE61836.1 hypothetical protein [Nocardiopsis listeri]
MSDNGGAEPGNRSSGEDADSWFKPSENRFRTQSDYQDPMDKDGDEPEGVAPQEPAAVFPDSGGYSGLSASRPALVEPYPDALGAPPTPPVASPEPQGPPGISYPGAGSGAYQPVTRTPGERPSAWEPSTPDQPPVPNTHPEWGARTGDVAAAAPRVPSWEPSTEPRDPAEPLWPGHEESAETPSENVSSQVPPGAEPSWGAEPDREPVREPEDGPSRTGGYPGIAASAQVPLPPEEPEESGPAAAHDSWAEEATTGARTSDAWGTDLAAAEDPVPRYGTDGLDDWTPGPNPGPDRETVGEADPWAGSEPERWVDPAPSYLEDRRYEASPVEEEPPGERPGEAYSEPYDELSAPFRSSVPADDGGLGTGSGNTWAFDRNDPRLPDVVRDAERRRRGETGAEPTGLDEIRTERDGGPDTGELSAAVPTSEDPLAAIANMQSRAKAKETEEPEGYHPDPAEEPSWSRGADNATRIFAPAVHDEEPPAYGSDSGPAMPHDELGFDGRGLDDYGAAGARSTDRAQEAPAGGGWNTGGYDELGYYDRGDQGLAEDGRPSYDGRGYADQGYADQGYADQGYREAGYPDQGVGRQEAYDDRGYDDQAYDDRGHEERTPDEPGFDDRPSTPVAGVPSDLGSPFSSHPQVPADAWNDVPDDDPGDAPDTRYEAAEEPVAEERGPEYDDGFTPADYGMTERPKSNRRRRDRIVEDFPGFEDRPLGGEAGDSYPGYDSIDFLADTEPGAMRTLWLGVASLIPFLGVITAILALFVTGPKAKKEIRGSRGTLDGLGLITTGTVFAVAGIVVTVISVAILVIL